MKIVICGGGIIGISCAYFLAKRDISCTIVEQEDIACAASGKAGGFLSKTFNDLNICRDLTRLSYDLHMEFWKLFPDVDYRHVNAYYVNINKAVKGFGEHLDWINDSFNVNSLSESLSHSAQVHPKKLCQRLLSESQRLTNNATQVIRDAVLGVELVNSNDVLSVKSVKLKSGQIIEADILILTLGPWTYKAVDWFPLGCIPTIIGTKSHSVVVKVPENVQIPNDCLFLRYPSDPENSIPEIYPRPDGTIYICGYDETLNVPEKASDIEIDSLKCNKLRKIMISLNSQLEPSKVVAEQACIMPFAADGTPIIGPIANVDGAYIATGHGTFGILTSTGTGFALSELIATGQCLSLDLNPFDPRRFL